MPAFEPVTKFNATVDDVDALSRHGAAGVPRRDHRHARPVHLQFRGNEGQVDGDEGELEPLVEPEFARVPPFRPEPDEAKRAARR